ncbi:DUF4062 domain-containing protein [Aquabacterium humicola]|uniref:DUF4062 domain-containing protein n=1 Tax=Aquabacterium humicola TaxID=3237377 RepID=UPI00254371CE|nr:DUF4062 domain-containing protein [Rubrivivax pictus]
MPNDIYLSSTLEDLRVEREAVRDMLARNGYGVKDSYQASDQALLASCFEDVASCALYVCIVGMRYGHRPESAIANPEGKSITQLELEHARRLGLPCLVFLKSEQAAYTRGQHDELCKENEHGLRIKTFRDWLQTKSGLRPAQFETIHELQEKVLAALPQALAKVASQRASTRESRAAEAVVRVPFMVDDLPPDFVPRPAEYAQLVSHLLDRERKEPLAITTALRGAGGFGKTVLARALCHNQDIRTAFKGGIMWVTLGENPGSLIGRIQDLIYMLSDRRPSFDGIEGASTALAEALGERDILMVIDDAWDVAHVQPFLRGGPRCARVITTRRDDVPPQNARRTDVDAMSSSESLALLSHGLPEGAVRAGGETLAALTRRLGEWPLLLKLVNSALRDRVVQRGQALGDALAYVNSALDEMGLTFFDASDVGARNTAVATTLDVSLAQLGEADRARLHELAVFPEDVAIPIDVIAALWAHSAGLKGIASERLCQRLAQLSLLQALDLGTRTVRLHDVVRQFLLGRVGGGVPALHALLLDSARPTDGAWAALAPAKGYWWDWLFVHLRAAGRSDELVATALDLRYLTVKGLLCTPAAVEADLGIALAVEPEHGRLLALRRSYTQAAHLLSRCRGRDEAQATLAARLRFVDALAPLASALHAGSATPRLTPVTVPPDLPHPALIRTLGEHHGTMNVCALSADGRRMATAGRDRTIRLWNTGSGVELLSLPGHAVRALRLSEDGSLLAAATEERRLIVWDTRTGEERLRCAGHVDVLTGCALNTAHRRVLSSSLDGTIRLWDLDSGALLKTLGRTSAENERALMVPANDAGHRGPVLGCDISSDGTLLASASSDQTVILWDVRTGEALRVYRSHEAAVNACAFSPDGRFLAAASADQTVCIWSATDTTVRLLAGHDDAVKDLAWSDDGATLLSASADGTLRMWDVATKRLLRSYTGHTDWVVSCGLSSRAGLIASASIDGTVRLWERDAPGSERVRRSRSEQWVQACAAQPAHGLLATTAADRGLLLWNPARCHRTMSLRGHEAAVRACAISADGRLAASASADKSVIVWDVVTGRLLHKLSGHRDWVNACSIDATGTLIASASNDRTLRLWDLASRARKLAFVAHAHWVTACVISPDRRWLYSAAADGTLRRWPLADIDEALWEDWLSGRRELAADAAVAALRPLELGGHAQSLNALALSTDGRVLASASSDRTLGLWDAQTGEGLRLLEGHLLDVNGCAFSPDGRQLASVSSDGCIKVWRVVDGQCLMSLRVDSELTDVRFVDADGARLVTVGAMGVYFLGCGDGAPA